MNIIIRNATIKDLACLKENYPSRTFYEKMGGKYLKTEKVVLGNKEYEEVIYEYDISKM